MPIDEGSRGQYSLTNEQIRDYATTHDDFFRQVLAGAEALVADNTGKDGSEAIPIPVGSLREMHLAMASMYKTIRDSPARVELAGGDHGDRGASCDYNPLNKVNTGDGINQ